MNSGGRHKNFIRKTGETTKCPGHIFFHLAWFLIRHETVKKNPKKVVMNSFGHWSPLILEGMWIGF